MSKKFVYVNTDGTYVETDGVFESGDFVTTSTGAGDAGKPILLNSSGLVDSSMAASYIGTLTKITSDLTVAAFYEYRVRQLTVSGADLILDSGDLIITG